MSANGRVRSDKTKSEFVNKLDEYRVQKLRGSADAIVVDASYVIKHDPELAVSEVTSREPLVVIVDKRGDLPYDAKILNQGTRDVIVVVSDNAPERRLNHFKTKDGVEVLMCGTHTVNLEALIAHLRAKKVNKVLVEDDGSLARRALNEVGVSEFYISVAPTMAFGEHTLFEGKLDREISLDLEGILQFGDHVVLHYVVK